MYDLPREEAEAWLREAGAGVSALYNRVQHHKGPPLLASSPTVVCTLVSWLQVRPYP